MNYFENTVQQRKTESKRDIQNSYLKTVANKKCQSIKYEEE